MKFMKFISCILVVILLMTGCQSKNDVELDNEADTETIPITINATIEEIYPAEELSFNDKQEEIETLKELFPSKGYDYVSESEEINEFLSNAEYKRLTLNIQGELEKEVELDLTAWFLVAELDNQMYIFEPTMPTNLEYENSSNDGQELAVNAYWSIQSEFDDYLLRPTGLIHLNTDNQGEVVTSDYIEVDFNFIYSNVKTESELSGEFKVHIN